MHFKVLKNVSLSRNLQYEAVEKNIDLKVGDNLINISPKWFKTFVLNSDSFQVIYDEEDVDKFIDIFGSKTDEVEETNEEPEEVEDDLNKYDLNKLKNYATQKGLTYPNNIKKAEIIKLIKELN